MAASFVSTVLGVAYASKRTGEVTAVVSVNVHTTDVSVNVELKGIVKRRGREALVNQRAGECMARSLSGRGDMLPLRSSARLGGLKGG